MPAGAVPIHEGLVIELHRPGPDGLAKLADLEASVQQSVRDSELRAEVGAWKKRREAIRLKMCDAIEALAELFGQSPEVTARRERALLEAAREIQTAGIADLVTKVGPDDGQLLRDARVAIGLVIGGGETAAIEVSRVLGLRADRNAVKKQWTGFLSAALSACFTIENADFGREFSSPSETRSTHWAGVDPPDPDAKPPVPFVAEKLLPAEAAAARKSKMEPKTIHMVTYVDGRGKGMSVDAALAELKSKFPEYWEYVDLSSMRAMFYRAKKSLAGTSKGR